MKKKSIYSNFLQSLQLSTKELIKSDAFCCYTRGWIQKEKLLGGPNEQQSQEGEQNFVCHIFHFTQ